MVTGRISEISNPFFEANIGLTDDMPKFNLFDANTIFTRPRMLPPSKITGTTLDRAVIAEGCIICATRITRSVIGVRSRIGAGSEIQNAYVMGSDYYQTLEELNISREKNEPTVGIGDRCFINNAIIDKNCSIGNDVRIDGSRLPDGNFDNYFVKDHIVVVKQHCTIPHNTVIE